MEEASGSGVGPRLRAGPTRRLLLAERALLEELGLQEVQQPVRWGPAFISVELLLIAGLAIGVLAMYDAGRLDGFNISEFFDTDHKERMYHMLRSMMSVVLPLPQLYMLVMIAKEEATVVLQALLVLIVFGLTLTTHLMRLVAKDAEHEEQTDAMHNTAHLFCGSMLTINIFIFMSIITVRLIFHFRLRTCVVSLKVVGPVIDFLVSRKVRELQALCLLFALAATTYSGILLQHDEGELTGGTVAVDVVAGLLTMAGLLVLLPVYLITHIGHNHRKVVREEDLVAALAELGSEHEGALRAGQACSSTKYLPYTRGVGPGDSGQFLRGRVLGDEPVESSTMHRLLRWAGCGGKGAE
jgi:hypothetical protein